MQLMSRLSIASIDGLYIKTYIVFLIYGCLIFLILFIEFRKRHHFRYFTFVLCCLVALPTFTWLYYKNQEQLIIYNIQDQMAIDLFIGSSCYSNISAKNISQSNLHFNVTPNGMHHRISQTYSLTKSKITAPIGNSDLIGKDGISVLFLHE